MLNHDQVRSLTRALDGQRVLSVYIDGRFGDPAERTAWRRRLAGDLHALRESIVNATREERGAFERAVSRLDECLADFPGAIGARGWVGFITGDGVAHAGTVPVRVSPIVTWEAGPRIAPYLGVLEQMQPLIVVMIDSRTARLYVVRPGDIQPGKRCERVRIWTIATSVRRRPRLGFTRRRAAL
ncbi:MAG TPA: hypothetical protein VMM18_08660 [Gemmatimonadaceae bacterium]|nr:hypothetical protein [Gemmatimonadaceae bacterium]